MPTVIAISVWPPFDLARDAFQFRRPALYSDPLLYV
jgi:hypothetical protein